MWHLDQPILLVLAWNILNREFIKIYKNKSIHVESIKSRWKLKSCKEKRDNWRKYFRFTRCHISEYGWFLSEHWKNILVSNKTKKKASILMTYLNLNFTPQIINYSPLLRQFLHISSTCLYVESSIYVCLSAIQIHPISPTYIKICILYASFNWQWKDRIFRPKIITEKVIFWLKE